MNAPTPHWHVDVPGTRWFRADLHLHTIDDPPRALPPEITGDRGDPHTLDAYARRFLDAAIEQRIEVLGLTPHAAPVGLSAVLTIRDLWLRGAHAQDGRPYRDLIYAVYPGFEPNFQDGNKGLHLLFLFEPNVDEARYRSALAALMDGRQSYDGHSLQKTPKSVPDAFRLLDDDKVVGRDGYVVIAAHPMQPNGLLQRPEDDIADLSQKRVLALELKRDRTLEEELTTESKLRYAVKQGRALLHSSDANNLPEMGELPADRELGYRFTLLKLARPTLAALRQALLAPAARVRDPFVRDGASRQLVVRPDLPEACPVDRPWIREVRVSGGTSFHKDQVFRFSPDLTCLIGGSMTGKSTLLDGLRFRFFPGSLPDERSELAQAVRDRAQQRLLSGGATVDVESPFVHGAQPLAEQMNVRFYSQGELKSLAEDADGIERLVFHLVPGRARELLRQRDELRALDVDLEQLTGRLVAVTEDRAAAEQSFRRADDARRAMERFTQAGTEALGPAQQDLTRIVTFMKELDQRVTELNQLVERSAPLGAPNVNDHRLLPALETVRKELRGVQLDLTNASEKMSRVQQQTLWLWEQARETLARTTAQVQQALVAAGGSAADLNHFEALAKLAQHFDSYRAAKERKEAEWKAVADEFARLGRDRQALTERHRAAVERVCEEIAARFPGRVRVEVIAEGRTNRLGAWILERRQKGLTQWWNGRAIGASGAASLAEVHSGLRAVADALKAKDEAAARAAADRIGMSATVAGTLIEVLSNHENRASFRALRSPDLYRILWVEDGAEKPLSELSGGRKVAVLLSLELESDDPTPLVIDQPEDELDNRFLTSTIIPALHRLKGRRQVIFATHNANLVVNGDADQVVALEADAHRARVYASGAIEEPAVRDAIVRTLDGGEEAFRLRREKYGY